MTPARRSG